MWMDMYMGCFVSLVDSHHRLQESQHMARTWAEPIPIPSFSAAPSFPVSISIAACALSIGDRHKLLTPRLMMPARWQ